MHMPVTWKNDIEASGSCFWQYILTGGEKKAKRMLNNFTFKQPGWYRATNDHVQGNCKQALVGANLQHSTANTRDFM